MVNKRSFCFINAFHNFATLKNRLINAKFLAGCHYNVEEISRHLKRNIGYWLVQINGNKFATGRSCERADFSWLSSIVSRTLLKVLWLPTHLNLANGALLSSTLNVTHCCTLEKLRWVIRKVDLTFSCCWSLNISCPSKGVRFRVNWWISSHEWRRVLDRGTNLQSSRTFLFLPQPAQAAHHLIANWPRKVKFYICLPTCPNHWKAKPHFVHG